MSEKRNYLVKVETIVSNEETGKDKKVTEQYLVNAVSCTDAEAIMTAELAGPVKFEVKSVTETKIIDYVVKK